MAHCQGNFKECCELIDCDIPPFRGAISPFMGLVPPFKGLIPQCKDEFRSTLVIFSAIMYSDDISNIKVET